MGILLWNNKKKKPKTNHGIMMKLSQIGKSLLFPIAMLPFAAILLRIGVAIPIAPDTANHLSFSTFSTTVSEILTSAGNVIFKNLAILFGAGLAFGLTKKRRGEAALVGFVGVALVMAMMSRPPYANTDNHIIAGGFYSSGLDLVGKFYGDRFHQIFGCAYNDILANNVFTGVLVGLCVAWTYNKFHQVEMPGVLGFFSGSRLVPAVVIMFIMVGILVYAAIWPWIGFGIYEFSTVLGRAQGGRWSNAGVMLVFGIINRLLLPFGLHNVPNALFWFSALGGTHPGINGLPVNGDINVFLNGIPLGNHGGTFQAGFFPIMMFGLPALVWAIYKNAGDTQKLKVLGLLGGSAFVSFFTGITEPIEYAFLYAAPLLYGMHIILTGIFSFIVGAFGIQIGFAFSAGFLDYVLSIPKSFAIIHANYHGFNAVMRNPFWILPIGAAAAATYYYLGSWLIRRFNLSTPGRNNNLIFSTTFDKDPDIKTSKSNEPLNKYDRAAKLIVKGLGGKTNIATLGNCATRLRLKLIDGSKVNKTLLQQGGSLGLIILSKTSIQVVMGPKVELFVNAIEKII